MELIKHIRLTEGYEIKLFYKGLKNLLYQFTSPEGEMIFEGDDFGPGGFCCIDSFDSVFSLLGFLTLKEGDTDSEYFQDYTEKQLEFSRNEAENLSLYPFNFEEGYILSFFEIEDKETFLVYVFDEFLGENETYEFHENYGKAFRKIIDQGIDSHLEGFTESNFEEGKDNRLILRFNLKEINILIRRLKENGFKEIAKEIEGILK